MLCVVLKMSFVARILNTLCGKSVECVMCSKTIKYVTCGKSIKYVKSIEYIVCVCVCGGGGHRTVQCLGIYL